MVQVAVLLAFAATVSALPLNINLGAYSPALVVGDGEISFGGKQDVTNLMNALEGAAVNGAAANAAGVKETALPPASPADPPAAAAAAVSPTASATPAVGNGATQITALQGMGKEIAPRVVPFSKDGVKSTKRDLAGFDRALNYAAAALKTSPEVQLGTGEGGSGVGITVKAGGAAPAAPAAGAAAPAAKRAELTDEELEEEAEEEEEDIYARSTAEAELTAEELQEEAEEADDVTVPSNAEAELTPEELAEEAEEEAADIAQRSAIESELTAEELQEEADETNDIAEPSNVEPELTPEELAEEAEEEAEDLAARSTGEAFYYGDEKKRSLKTTVTTMYIRGSPAGVSKTFDGSFDESPAVKRRSSSPMQKRAVSSGIDGVNLNVEGGQAVTLTFVETAPADDDQDAA
ncbi:hypothetical protein PVAG01_05580 [Phlyctema vagabunda]|uniref:Uncharacterized protein n=1 Tax=Phlyctema vagabunda TaxID=108571 RepID=A0ABR4PKR8_9HELO